MKKINIYQQTKRICKIILGVIGIIACLGDCSPKERELLRKDASETVEEVVFTAGAETMQSLEDACVQSNEQVLSGGDSVLQSGEQASSNTCGTADDDKSEAKLEVSESDSVSTILVHVCGAVQNPCVVELASGSRASDALAAAGGYAENASTTYVNLAAEVLDGQQLFFPTEEEVKDMRDTQNMSDVSKNLQGTSSGVTDKVNINTASMTQLCTLPGIGSSKAEAIISYRDKNGPFSEAEDIMKVAGIKENAYAKIQDKITVQ